MNCYHLGVGCSSGSECQGSQLQAKSDLTNQVFATSSPSARGWYSRGLEWDRRAEESSLRDTRVGTYRPLRRTEDTPSGSLLDFTENSAVAFQKMGTSEIAETTPSQTLQAFTQSTSVDIRTPRAAQQDLSRSRAQKQKRWGNTD